MKGFLKWRFLIGGLAIGLVVAILGVVGLMWWSSYHDVHTPLDTRSSSAVITPSDNFLVSTTTYKYGGITFQVVSGDGATLNVLQRSKSLFTVKNDSIYPAESSCSWDVRPLVCDTATSTTFAKDINGNGNKDFIFVSASSGSAGNTDYYIFELGKGDVLTQLADITTVGDATFKDLDADGRLDIKTADGTFGYWNTDGASSPYPSVILSWNSTKQAYIVNESLMRKPAPTDSTIAKQVTFYSTTNWSVPVQTSYGPGNEYSVPWSYALDLIYSGNAAVASKYLDEVWPAIASSTNTKGEFTSLEDLKNKLLLQLQQSPYYQSILTLNSGKLF